ncbi:hypothetical protein E2C01_038972 [Portunus trituberculatus]|uniref:Uncharacterized protein n=1 Tax=Portunus trituberculatus TaxID=210409 RepID=A0A5B7FIB5_PORTR|nr:hypothetical protein [Portunus trituberculatus]
MNNRPTQNGYILTPERQTDRQTDTPHTSSPYSPSLIHNNIQRNQPPPFVIGVSEPPTPSTVDPSRYFPTPRKPALEGHRCNSTEATRSNHY